MLKAVADRPIRSGAKRIAQADAEAIAQKLACEDGSVAERMVALKFAAEDLGCLIGDGTLDRSVAGDLLADSIKACGLGSDADIDAVQEVIAAGLRRGENQALDEHAAEDTAKSRTVSRCAADITPEPISWLWKDRLALGKLGLLAGPPGLGKSHLSCWLAAAVTTGGLLPGGVRAPLGSVIMIGCEDDPGDTVRPRLEAAGCDIEKVHLLDWVLEEAKKGDERRHFDVRKHGPQLLELTQQLGDVRLIVIDPITAHMGKTDSHVTADVRQALAPLQTMAAEIVAVVLLISHLNKGAGDGSAMARVTGSGAFIALSRSAWMIGTDPNDPTKRRCVLAPIKNNLSPDRSALAYTIEPLVLPCGIGTSQAVFDPAPIAITADDLVLQPGPASDEKKTALGEAEALLRAELADGPRPTREIKAAANDACIAWRTIERAKAVLKVESKKIDGRTNMSVPAPARWDSPR